MHQLLPVLRLATVRRGAAPRPRLSLLFPGLALVLVACASHSPKPGTQAAGIRERDRLLAAQAGAIQAIISQSGTLGALVFFDAKDGRPIIVPGDTPGDGWARYNASSEHDAGDVLVPPVLAFVSRSDIPKAPEAVTRNALEEQRALRASVAALETEVRAAQGRIEERLSLVERQLDAAVAAAKQATDTSIAAARADMQAAVNSLAGDLAAVRKFALQTAQLGWLNHDMNVENASGMRRIAAAGQELTASSARLEEAMRKLSETLAEQLKELATRLDAIQGKVSGLK